MSLEEIDGDIFVGGAEAGGNLLGANPEIREELKKPKGKKRKKSGKEVINAKAIDPRKHAEGFSSTSQQDEADIASYVSTPGPSPQSIPSKVNQKKKKKKQKQKKPKVIKDAMAPPSEIEVADTLEGSPILGVTQTKKKLVKGESKALFVVGPVISTVAGDNEGTQEQVSDVEALKSKDSKTSKKSKTEVPKVVKEVVPDVGALKSKNGLQKKVKLGSKARRLLKLQKQQGQKGIKHVTKPLWR